MSKNKFATNNPEFALAQRRQVLVLICLAYLDRRPLNFYDILSSGTVEITSTSTVNRYIKALHSEGFVAYGVVGNAIPTLAGLAKAAENTHVRAALENSANIYKRLSSRPVEKA